MFTDGILPPPSPTYRRIQDDNRDLEAKHQITVSNLNVASWRKLDASGKLEILKLWQSHRTSEAKYGTVLQYQYLALVTLFFLGTYLEKLIKHWKLISAQLAELDRAISESTNCLALRPVQPKVLRHEIATLGHLQMDAMDIYLHACDFWDKHPGLAHIPQARVSTTSKITHEEHQSALAALWKESGLRRAGRSISTSTGGAAPPDAISLAEKVRTVLVCLGRNAPSYLNLLDLWPGIAG